MQRFTARWLAAFSVLALVMHEAHELAHTIVGRVLCGAWAERDFNAWSLPASCTTPVPTAAGPVFSAAGMLLGIVLARRAEWRQRWVGIALIFACNPLARIITTLMRGGDELTVVRNLSGGSVSPGAFWATAALVVVVFGGGIVAGWRATASVQHRVAGFVAVLIGPMVITGTLLFVVLNGLLKRGVMAAPVAGMPGLVLAVSLVVAAMGIASASWLRGSGAGPVAIAGPADR
ncbi:MAG TPA: hypothetical protein VF665_16445 [Longimicrobium sp.]|jgi:hypothetical protein|uniref:hypothetical protein n=1 Tax=Longimicrobium sp. TaxID=2029185 RepID=UPI002ED9F6A8